MDGAQLVTLLPKASIFLLVLSVGLRAAAGDTAYLVHHRGLLLRSVLAMNVAMPAVAAAFAALFSLHPAAKVALVALAVSPVPPFLPDRALKAVTPRHEAYVYGLLVAAAVLSIVVVPLTVALLAAFAHREMSVDPLAIARIVTATVLLPLGAGLALRHWWPRAAAWSSAVHAAGALLLAVVLVLAFARLWPAMGELVGDGTLAAIVAMALIGLAIGHLLGGPAEDDRTVLAFATASRHPGVALVVANATHETLAPAAILLAVLVGAAATAPYAAWRKRARTAPRARRAGRGVR